MPHTWDPDTYLRYADERGRPFVELLDRVAATAPRTVVDLGCGPGNLTALLAERWPSALVSGIDSSAEMVAAARARGDGVDYAVADLRDWTPVEPVDVLVTNATLQWVPGHLELLPRLVEAVAPGGWLALQVPGNVEEPSHVVRRELAAEPAYAAATAGLPEPAAHDATTYLQALTDLGFRVDAWETTYLHVLSGPDPVFTWISGTSARPMLDALTGDLRERFVAELKQRLVTAYGDDEHVVLPFRRVFAVGQRA